MISNAILIVIFLIHWAEIYYLLQNTVAQYIATRPLLNLCEEARAGEGTRVPLRWWNQTDIDWETAKARGEGEGGEADSTSRLGSSTEGEEKRNGERGNEGPTKVVEEDGHRLGDGKKQGERGREGKQTVPADRGPVQRGRRNELRRGRGEQGERFKHSLHSTPPRLDRFWTCVRRQERERERGSH